MIHRGEIVEDAVRANGITITRLAKKLGRSRRTIYNLFQNDKLDWETIIDIGKIIHYDFGQHFTELIRNFGDEQVPYIASKEKLEEALKTALMDASYWKDKYISLLEEKQGKQAAPKKPRKPGKKA